MYQSDALPGADEQTIDLLRERHPEGFAPPVRVALGHERAVEVAAHGNKTVLRVQGEHRQQLDIEIRFDLDGPVVTVRAPKLELSGTKDISATCETFSVDASKRIELRSQGDIVQHAAGEARVDAESVDVKARLGAIRLEANDEVQALGEMILLNCEHPRTAAPMPGWVKTEAPAVPVPVPAEPTSGDPEVIAALLDRRR